jgi:hypothetical protein
MKTSAALVAVAVAAIAAPVAAGSASSPCSLLSGSQVQSVHVSDTSCAAKPVKPGPLGTIYIANWGSSEFTQPHVFVSITKPSSPLVLALEKKNASGTPVKVGSWGRGELANGKTAGTLTFIARGYFVALLVQTPTKKPLSSVSQLATLGNAIVKKL